jgi:hypothetical protein
MHACSCPTVPSIVSSNPLKWPPWTAIGVVMSSLLPGAC